MLDMRYLYILFFPILLFFSCQSTQLSSIKNPNSDLNSLKNIMIVYRTNNIKQKKQIESSFIKVFQQNGVRIVSESEIINQFKTYTQVEYDKAVLDSGVDSILRIESIGSSSNSTYIPQVTQTYNTTTMIGNRSQVNTYTTTTGGYSVTETIYGFSYELFDLRIGEIAWKASSETSDELFFTQDGMFESIAQTVFIDIYGKVSTSSQK